jgi:hypothetical protein
MTVNVDWDGKLDKNLSKYMDHFAFQSDPQYKNRPVVLSLNIQSLNSKYNELKSFINERTGIQWPQHYGHCITGNMAN